MEGDHRRSAEPAADFVWNPGPIEYAPGVTLCRHRGQDEYTGLPCDIIAAGLCREDQLPGAPGRGVASCTFWPDGTPKGTGGCGSSPGLMKLNRMGRRLRCRIYREPTEQERQYWKKKDAERDAERLRESAERAESQNQDRLRNQDPVPSFMRMDPDEHLRRLFSNCTDEEIDFDVEIRRRLYDRALRISREVKDARRQEASSIASSDGVVIFPKRWQHA